MTEDLESIARELARKAIGWRARAMDEQRRREAAERQPQRSTWSAIERIQRPRDETMDHLRGLAFGLAHAYVIERVKTLDGPLSTQMAGELMRRWCDLVLRSIQQHPETSLLVAIDFGGGTIDDALQQGAFGLEAWTQLMHVMDPPPATRAILHAIWDVAPVPEESDYKLEFMEER